MGQRSQEEAEAQPAGGGRKQEVRGSASPTTSRLLCGGTSGRRPSSRDEILLLIEANGGSETAFSSLPASEVDSGERKDAMCGGVPAFFTSPFAGGLREEETTFTSVPPKRSFPLSNHVQPAPPCPEGPGQRSQVSYL